MKKKAVYYRTTSGRRRGSRVAPEEFEAMREKCIKVFSNSASGVITIETSNSNFESEIKRFEKMLKSMKKYGTETLLMTDKERISDNNDEVYLICKLAEDNGIEIQFVKDKLSSKDIIVEFEENNMTGMDMNL